ncbi:CP2J6 protein, partial [Polypterus senegalus]
MSVWWLWEQLDAWSALIFIVVLLFVSDYLKHRDGKNFPPGPFWVPFVGDLFKMASDHPHLYMAKLTEKYGNVYSLRSGGSKIVIVNGYKIAKEALLTQGYALTGWPQAAAYDRIYKIPGLTLSNGYPWKEHRRFTLTALRNFGVGKKSLESIIMEEAKFFVEAFEQERGQPFNPHNTINNAISNIICLIVLGHRFEYSNSHYREIQHLINRGVVLEGSWWAWVYNAFPRMMRYLPGHHNELFSSYGKVQDFLREEIRKHKKDLDPTSPRDYIDAYLVEIEKTRFMRSQLLKQRQATSRTRSSPAAGAASQQVIRPLLLSVRSAPPPSQCERQRCEVAKGQLLYRLLNDGRAALQAENAARQQQQQQKDSS